MAQNADARAQETVDDSGGAPLRFARWRAETLAYAEALVRAGYRPGGALGQKTASTNDAQHWLNRVRPKKMQAFRRPPLAPRSLSTMKALSRRVARRHGIEVSDLLGPRRHKHLCKARREFWFLAAKAGRSLPQIGAFSNRDHTTILAGLKRYWKETLGCAYPGYPEAFGRAAGGQP